MTVTVLRHKNRKVLNFTKRLDIAREQVRFDASVVQDTTRYRIEFADWPSIAAALDAHCEVTIRFRLTGTNHWYEQVGTVADLMRRKGVVKGVTRGGFNPELLGAELTVSDQKDHSRIVLMATMRKPDDVDADIEIEDDEVEQQPVRPFRQAAGSVNSVMDIVEDASTVGYWSLDFEGDCVRLLVSPSLSKSAVVSEPRTMRAVHPTAFRQVLQAMLFQEERYEGKPWYGLWKRFTSELLGEKWSVLFDESQTDEERDNQIDLAVAEFVSKYLPETALPAFQTTQDDGE